MLRVRFTDGPRKGQIAEVNPAAGWAMLRDGRATDPRSEVPRTEVPRSGAPVSGGGTAAALPGGRAGESILPAPMAEVLSRRASRNLKGRR